MSHIQQIPKPTTTKTSIKAKNDKDTHARPQPDVENTAAHSSNLESEELLNGELSQILKPPPSGVLGHDGSSILQQHGSFGGSSARSTPSPATLPSFPGKNFAGLPARSAVQTKLTVGAAHDPYEEEADQVAEQVMRMPASTFAAPAGVDGSSDDDPSIQRSLAEDEELQTKPLASAITPWVQRAPAIDEDTVKQVVAEDAAQPEALVQRAAEEEDELQTKRVSAADSFETDDGFEGRVAVTRGGGSPLPDTVRTFMEPRFGADFSGVRLHSGNEAANLNRQVSAQAFTLGQDIYLGEGKADVTSESGKHLLAHELTHVVQQGGAVARKPLVQRATDPETETEAPPLSMDAALAEAQTEVTEADVAQEEVVLDAEPVELPADNKVAGVAAQSAGGGGAAAAAPAEAAPASGENTPTTEAQNTSATGVTGPFEETATQPPTVDASATSASVAAIESTSTALPDVPVDTGAVLAETMTAPVAAATATTTQAVVKEVTAQASASAASTTTTNVSANEAAQPQTTGVEPTSTTAPIEATATTAATPDASATATKAATDKPAQATTADDTTAAQPTTGTVTSAQSAAVEDAGAANSISKEESTPSSDVSAPQAGAPVNEAAQSTTATAAPANAAPSAGGTAATSTPGSSSTTTKAATDQQSPAATTDNATTTKPAAGAQPVVGPTSERESAPSGDVSAPTASVPADKTAQPTTPSAAPANTAAPIADTATATAKPDASAAVTNTTTDEQSPVATADNATAAKPATGAATDDAEAAKPTSKEKSTPASDISAPLVGVPVNEAAQPATSGAAATSTPAAPAGPIEKTTPAAVPTPTETPAAIKPAEETEAPAQLSAQPTEAAASAQPAEASATPATVRPEDEEEKPVRRTLLRRMIQRALAVAPRSAEEDPAFQRVVVKSKAAAQQEKAHKPAQGAAAESQAAADPKGKDVEMEAQKRQVADMRAQPTGTFNAEAFRQKLFEKIKETAPQNLKEADEFKKNNKVGAIKNSIVGEVKEQKQQAEGPLEKETEQAPDKGGIPGKAVKSLEKTEAGSQPPDIGAKDAAPKAKTEAEVSVPLQEQSKSLDQQMAQGGVTEEQLANSNEPAFQQALKEKKDAQQNAQDAPVAYRKDEQAVLDRAQGEAQSTADAKSKETRSEKEQLLAQVFGLQGQTKGVDESKRQEVSARVADFYLKTKQDVEQILDGMDGKVNEQFEKGATAAKQAFEDHVDKRMSKYKWDRYLSRLDGPILWVRDQFAGLPEEVNAFYAEGRNIYLAQMNTCLGGIANYVAAELTRAKQRIAEGQQAIGTYVAKLSPDLQQVGREAAQKIQGKFDELVGSVDSKQEDLIDSLAQSYNEKVQEVDARIEEMKLANSGLINKAVQTIGGVIKTIQELGQLLMNALQRAAGAVSQILQDPIKFLGNLIKGVAQGLQRFGSNILTHLQTGLLGWLTGALGGVITAFPKSFTDLRGILSMVLEILGLTYTQIRGKVVKAIGEKGEPVVSALEKAWEIFQIIRTEGLGGLWEFIKDMIGDLKAMVIDQIQSIIANEVIQAGIQWIVGLLGGPAGAFIKAVQAIIKIVTWFVNNASRLLAFVNSVLDSIVSIASGNVSAAAQYIENTLAKALPLVIGFLAELLGLGGIAKKVQGVIAKIRAPIDKAIAWIVKKAVALAKKILAKLGGGKKKDAATSGGAPGQLEDKVIGKEETFSDGKESHRLWIEVKGDNPALMVASSPRTLLDFLESKEVKELDDSEGHVAQAKALMPQTTREAKQVVQALTQRDQGKAESSDKQTEQDMDQLAPHLQWIFKNVSDKSRLIELAVSSMGIVQFMKAMARGKTVMGVSRQDFNSTYNDTSKKIGNKTAREWLQDKFRAADSGKHEWIPTDMIDKVVERASSSDEFVEGVKWIDLQHKLRVDTSWVIFKPSMWETTTYRENEYLVPDGHSGALTLGLSIQNSGSLHRGQEDFHNELRGAFYQATTIGSYFVGLKQVIEKWVWQGEAFSPPLVPFVYYLGEPVQDDAQLARKQQQNYAKLINDLERVKAEVIGG